MVAVSTERLQKVLRKNTAEGKLYEKLPHGKLRCFACGHRCVILPGKPGICRVRFNEDGKLYVPYGYVAGFQIDPVEKKPFFHALPGSLAASFGMLGCDFHCSYCQNWITSQALRDEQAITSFQACDKDSLIRMSLEFGSKVVASTYNEPLITSEWAKDVFEKAKAKGLITAYVSNGNATREVLRFLRPVCDLYKVDLKGFDEKRYRRLGGTLKNVCRSIEQLKELGFWVEIVTLLIPGFNDRQEELRNLCQFIASVSPEIPWHVTAFHPDYKMQDRRATQPEDLLRAAKIGEEEGLKFIYLGNLPGQVGHYENTYCPDCRTLLIERFGMRVTANFLRGNRCPKCNRVIPGIFT